MDFIRKNLFVVFLVFIALAFFWQFLIKGLLPIPSDTIIGLYHPFRDMYAKDYPRGIPFKNSLITDPVRQTYPWKTLVIEAEKSFRLPLWNPYNFSGSPLLANFQSGTFYPLNLLYFVLPFSLSWSLIIVIQPILAGLFMYFYLSNLKLRKEASVLGGIVFAFSGFSIAWLEWGNIIHTALWAPLILLSIDKIFELPKRKINRWNLILLLSLLFSFFAGHLQTFFYIGVISAAYFILRLFSAKEKIRTVSVFSIPVLLFIVLSFVQWYPTLQFILLSARSLDVISYETPGWFIPWQNIVQFIIPDFFGNPTTLNYWGVWNYGEFIGYVGIIPLIMALFTVLFKRSREAIFFSLVLIASIILAYSNPLSKIPFIFNIPFISTAQPTRLMFLIDLSLAVLSAAGLDYYVKNSKKILLPIAIVIVLFVLAWSTVILHIVPAESVSIVKHNLVLPTALFVISAILLIIPIFRFIEKRNLLRLFVVLYILISVVDLFRFGWKFESFTNKKYLFPSDKILTYIQKQQGVFRILNTNSEIMPPNFSIMYKLQVADGYDPLYLRRYGEFIAAFTRGKPDIKPPFGFNRIITWQNSTSQLMDFLGARYVLTRNPVENDNLSLVASEGETKVYLNNSAYSRAFFVDKTIIAGDNQDAIRKMFGEDFTLQNNAIVQEVGQDSGLNKNWVKGSAVITKYDTDYIQLKTQNEKDGFMVLTDVYYPTWKATIDGKQVKIYLTDYTFRGLVVPAGKHVIEFTNSLF